MHWIVLEPLLILLQQSASRLDIDQNLQRNRAVSQREHGFLVKASRECSGCFIHVLRARHITDDDMRLRVIQVDYSGRRQDPAPLHCNRCDKKSCYFVRRNHAQFVVANVVNVRRLRLRRRIHPTANSHFPSLITQESPAIADKPARRESLPKLLQFDVPTTLSLTILAYLHAF